MIEKSKISLSLPSRKPRRRWWVVIAISVFVVFGSLIIWQIIFPMAYRTPANKNSSSDGMPASASDEILNRFRGLSGVSDIAWTMSAAVTNSTGIGPNSQLFRGYIKVESATAASIFKAYSWQAIPAGNSMIVVGKYDGSKILDWQISRQFTRQTLYSNYVGEIYFSPSSDLLYFDIAR